MATTAPQRAVIYCRLSQDRTGAGVGVEMQERQCRELAERLGWTVVHVYPDNDLSATSGKVRPQYEQMLAAVEAGQVDGILAWHADRLHRRPLELERYITACEQHDVATHTVKAGPLDLSTPSGRMVARMLGAAARAEAEQIASRTTKGKTEAAARGAWSGGPRPYGYRLTDERERQQSQPGGKTPPPLVPVPAEAEAVREAAQAILNGGSLRGAARALNDRGSRTLTGTPWTGSALRKVLLRPTNAGLRTHKGEEVGRGGWEALLPEDQWRAVCAILNDPARRPVVSRERRWLLSGLALCGVCSTPLTANTTAGGTAGARTPAYRCRAVLRDGATAGRHVVRDARALDEYARALVVGRLARADAVTLLAAPAVDVAPLHVEADGLAARLDEAGRLYAEGVITAAQLTTTTKRLRELQDGVQARLAASVQHDALAGLAGHEDAAERFDALPLERRRAVVDALVSLTVLPRTHRGRLPGGGYFDPEAVAVTWRQA